MTEQRRGRPQAATPRATTVQVRLTDDEARALTTFAGRTGRTASKVIRAALAEYLARHECDYTAR